MAYSSWSVFACVICLLAAEMTSADLSHVMEKRSDDTSPLQIVVNQLSQDLTQMQARMAALETAHNTDKAQQLARIAALEAVNNKQVSFLAQSSAETVSANAPIPFSPALNIGNGYDASQHVFVAPYPGVYIFTFQVFYHHGGDQLLVDFMSNAQILVRLRVFDQVMETSEASAIVVQAKAGDRFWLRPDHDATLYTGVHSFFSGSLLAAH